MFIRCCGPQDHTDPCKGENLMLSLVHVDHYIERAKEEDDLLSVYRWLMVKSLMSQVNLNLQFASDQTVYNTGTYTSALNSPGV